MSLHPLGPGVRRGEQVFEEIHAAITSGRIPAGSRLRIRQLAEELGTSVMPVREALGRLEEIGVVATEPYKGAVVKAPGPRELLDVYAVRRLLEAEAAAQGAAAITPAGIEACEERLAAMRTVLAEGRGIDYLDHDEAMLTVLYDAAGNPVLSEQIRALWVRCRWFKIAGVRQELEAESGAAPAPHFQERLLAAVRARDAEAARTVTLASLDASIERIRTEL